MLDAYIIERIRQDQRRPSDSAGMPLRIRIPEQPEPGDEPGSGDEATPTERGIVEIDQSVDIGVTLEP